MRLKTIRKYGYFFCFLLMIKAVCAQPSVAFFYGAKVPKFTLCGYDIVVVDPHSDFNPQAYCSSISQPYAYVSVGEVAQNAPYVQDIPKEWVISKNVAWNNNYVLDQTQPQWQAYFLSHLIDPLWDKGYKGFFLDTLDSYFLAAKTTEEQQKQIAGIVHLIRQIKVRHPDAKIILNRGFQLLPDLHADVDYVLIESLYDAWNQEKRAYEKTSAADQNMLFGEINRIRQWNLPIIVIDYLPPAQKAKAAQLAQALQKQGFIPWITDNSLQEIYLGALTALPRIILVVLNSKLRTPQRYIAQMGYVSTILQYYGYTLEYVNYDDTRTLPEPSKDRYAGILVVSDTEVDANKPIFSWALKQISRQFPLVFINNFSIPKTSTALKQLNITVTPLVKQSKQVKINSINKQYIGFEVQPFFSPYDFIPIRSGAGSQVLLQTIDDQKATEDAVAITPWGGYVLSPYFTQYLPNYLALWVINPFTFFPEALRLKTLPVPDVTTENGRRLMSVHIDGDGFMFQAKWVGGRLAAEELRDKILKVFQIPTGFSVITGEIAPNGVNAAQSPKLMEVARSIFALPWIEIASHSFSHPFNWQHHDSNDGQLIGESYSLNIPGYQFNLETEIAGSVNFINQHLAPPDKKCSLFFWSGLANPSIEALAIADKYHVLNINGMPDTNITKEQSSLTRIQPMGMRIGSYYQTFAPIDGDFYYINDFGGPLYGFQDVIQTLQMTDKPRRFKPIDLYYHIYSASTPATLEALQKVYKWALAQSVMNIHISDYIKKVLDFTHMNIAQLQSAWVIESTGELRELRSPMRFGYPDLLRSQNVVGFRTINDDLHIHLGANPFTVLYYQSQKPTQPYLAEANGRVVSFTRNGNQLTIQLKGYLPLEFSLGNVSACRVTMNTLQNTRANQDGTVTYQSTKDFDEIHINC